MAGAQIDIALLLDDKNREFYRNVAKIVPVTIKYGNEPYYGVFQKDHKATIFVPHGNCSPASFAHELLHVYLNSYGVNIGGSLKLQSRGNPILCKIMSDNLADHICNILEHQKMYPLFLDMGYNGNEFLADANAPVLTNKDVAIIKHNLKVRIFLRWAYNPLAVDAFIGKYIGAKGSCIGAFDYGNELEQMRQIEPNLCSIIDSLLDRWGHYDFTKEGDLSVDSYIDIASDFLQSLEEWALIHKI